MPNSRNLRSGDKLRYDFQIENISESIISNVYIYKKGEASYTEGITISPGFCQTISKTYFLKKMNKRALSEIFQSSGHTATGEIITETLTGLNAIK